MHRIYTVQGTYRERSREPGAVLFRDEVVARCAEQAFVIWERRHTQKRQLRFESIEPIF